MILEFEDKSVILDMMAMQEYVVPRVNLDHKVQREIQVTITKFLKLNTWRKNHHQFRAINLE